MTDSTTETRAAEGGKQSLQSVSLKRQVTIKSLVTEAFRGRAKTELTDELKLIEAQLEQLENQYHGMLAQLESVAKTGQNVTPQLEQLNREVQEKRNQLGSVKMQISSNLANLDKIQNGDTVVTGVLENYIEVAIGDNIYDKLRGAEIILEDGLVKSILG